MAWLMIDQSILTNQKTVQVALDLNITVEQVFVHLFKFWNWALDNVPEHGHMRNMDARKVAYFAGWSGDAETFLDALLNAGGGDDPGFLKRCDDGQLCIHDWSEYSGKWVARRKADKERKRVERAKSKPDPTDESEMMGYVPQTSAGCPTDVTEKSTPKKEKQIERENKTTTAEGARDVVTLMTNAEREVIGNIMQVPGMADIPVEAVLAHYREVAGPKNLSAEDQSYESIKFRDYHTESRKRKTGAFGWRNALTNWYQRATPTATNGRASPARKRGPDFSGFDEFNRDLDALERRHAT